MVFWYNQRACLAGQRREGRPPLIARRITVKPISAAPVTSARSALLYGTAAIIFLVFGLSSLFNPFGTDHGEYATIAAAAQRGSVIYRDIFNVKPPMTHLLHEAALAVFGSSMLSIRIVDLIWQGATAVLIILIGRALFRDQATALLAALIYTLWYYSIDYWNTAQTDGFLSLPVAIGVLAYLRYLDRRRLRLLCLGGLAFGVAVFFKYPIGIIVPFLALLLFLDKQPGRLRAIAALLGGFGAAVAGFMFYLLAQGALGDFLSIQLTYIPLYNQIDTANYGYGTAFVRRFVTFWQTDTIVTSPITPLVAYMVMRRTAALRRYGVLLLWWLAATIHLGIQQKFYYYHGIPLLLPEALLLAYCLRELYRACRGSAVMRLLALAGGMLALAWFYVSLGHLARHRFLADVARVRPSLSRVYTTYPTYNQYSPKNTLEVAAYLKQQTAPDETIFIWGTEPTIYFLAERAPASRFIYSFILYERFEPAQYRADLIDELRRRPAYIIVPEGDAMPDFTGSELDSLAALPRFPDLQRLIETEYAPDTQIHTFHLYRRK
jgi:4-amino-4-deoxy-L-arabinose transferase-like glycosyltransferase